MKMNILRAKKILEDAGMILERNTEFYEPSSRPEFDDPYYDWDGEETKYDERNYKTNCEYEEKGIAKSIKKNDPDQKFSISVDYYIEDDTVKYEMDLAFPFDHVPSEEEQRKIDYLIEDAMSDGCEIDWQDSDSEIGLANANGNLIGIYNKPNKRIKFSKPVDKKLDHYLYMVSWYCEEEAKKVTHDEPEYAGNDY